MENIRIMTDSNSGITPEQGHAQGIFVVPMPFTINGEEYLEGLTISRERFFQLLGEGADVRTSQPSPFYLEEVWQEMLTTCDKVIYIPMSSGLSKTCETAQKFAQSFGGRVLVADNRRISVPQKISVFEAARMAKAGKSAQEIMEYLERRSMGKCSVYLTVSVLKYLKKGGRITPAAAALGDVLKLKPILSTRGERFDKFAVAISMVQAKKKMIQKIQSELETEFYEEYQAGKMALLIAHAEFAAEAERFREELEAQFPQMKVLYVDELSLSIACHTGAGALGVGVCMCDYLNET